MALLEQAKENTQVQFPLERLFPNDDTAKVLDFFLENYSLSCAEKKISKIIDVSDTNLTSILKTLVKEKILQSEKNGLEIKYFLNSKFPRTVGLFQYFRATLDDNLSGYEYNNS